ncbi:PRC-barrel domain-containing protein [Tardiphaga sp.]|uniref:PRC-barrel domain-containing protein n=1 Tax=Tardiphaga sp. TaxID=1926292 RepID=UPI0025F58C43|nr:PRC-barrel domain-containing protein [Tardiphaga sp.]
MDATRLTLTLALACAVVSASPSWSADENAPSQSAPAASPVAPPSAATPPKPDMPPNIDTKPESKPDAKADAVVPAPTPPPAVAAPPSVTVIDAVDAHGILGRDVRSPASENMGRIADVIVDRSGQARAAVIDFGGFLGVGSRKIVVEWAALHFWNVADKAASITLELTREQVRAAPEYKDDAPIVVLGASGALHPLRFPPRTMQER